MIAEIECHLFLARRVCLVVRVVGHHRHDDIVAWLHACLSEIDCDGEIASLVLSDKLSVHIKPLAAHNSLEHQFRFAAA